MPFKYIFIKCDCIVCVNVQSPLQGLVFCFWIFYYKKYQPYRYISVVQKAKCQLCKKNTVHFAKKMHTLPKICPL